MYLRLIIRDAWTILAICASEEQCDVLDFAEQLRRELVLLDENRVVVSARR